MGTELKNKAIGLGCVVLLALLFLFPTIKVVVKKLIGSEVTSQELVEGGWISKPIGLGLDLSGGVHLLYQVKAKEAVKSKLQVIANSIRSDLRKKKVPVTKARVTDHDEIEITLLSAKKIKQAKDLITEDYTSLSFMKEGTEESGRPRLTYGISEKESHSIQRTAISQAVETLRNRVDQFGVAEPLIQKVEEDRILLQMPGVDDIEAVKKVVGKVARLEFRMLPRSADALTITLKDREGNPVKVEDVVQMTGDAVDHAQVGVDRMGQREVSLRMTPEGGKTFARVTGNNVGRNMAIILDGVVYSSPVIREAILGGQCSITGGFSFQEAHELAVVLRAGALPAPLEILEERTVGPSLGAESIRKGLIAIGISFVLVIAFMGYYYKKSGWVAISILVLNVFLVLAALSAFGATLTLPGLAGLALTVGMAVDANVIIFERIREEIKNGSSRDAAVAAGFDKALSAIIDSNLTTLLAGLILYYFGTGPIRGFAVTLSIGIVTTIFCATFVSRLAFNYFPLEGEKGLSI